VKRLRVVLLAAGLSLTLGPPILFAIFAVLAYRADPIDQSGWAAWVGGSLILTMMGPQVGIMMLLVYLFVRMMK
jgi:hypothetical protein